MRGGGHHHIGIEDELGLLAGLEFHEEALAGGEHLRRVGSLAGVDAYPEVAVGVLHHGRLAGGGEYPELFGLELAGVGLEEGVHVEPAGEGIAHKVIVVGGYVVGRGDGERILLRKPAVRREQEIGPEAVVGGGAGYRGLIAAIVIALHEVAVLLILLGQAEKELAVAPMFGLEREAALGVGHVDIVVDGAPLGADKNILRGVDDRRGVSRIEKVVEIGRGLVPAALIYGGGEAVVAAGVEVNVAEIGGVLAAALGGRVPVAGVYLPKGRAEGVPAALLHLMLGPRFPIDEVLGLKQFGAGLQHKAVAAVGAEGLADIRAALLLAAQEVIDNVGRHLVFVHTGNIEHTFGVGCNGVERGLILGIRGHDDTCAVDRHEGGSGGIVLVGDIVGGVTEIGAVGTAPVEVVGPVGVAGGARPHHVARHDHKVEGHRTVTGVGRNIGGQALAIVQTQSVGVSFMRLEIGQEGNVGIRIVGAVHGLHFRQATHFHQFAAIGKNGHRRIGGAGQIDWGVILVVGAGQRNVLEAGGTFGNGMYGTQGHAERPGALVFHLLEGEAQGHVGHVGRIRYAAEAVEQTGRLAVDAYGQRIGVEADDAVLELLVGIDKAVDGLDGNDKLIVSMQGGGYLQIDAAPMQQKQGGTTALAAHGH